MILDVSSGLEEHTQIRNQGHGMWKQAGRDAFGDSYSQEGESHTWVLPWVWSSAVETLRQEGWAWGLYAHQRGLAVNGRSTPVQELQGFDTSCHIWATHWHWSWPSACTRSHVWLCATRWTLAHQAPLSMGFSRQEYWSGLPFPSPGDLPDPEDQTHVSCTDRQILYHQATGDYGSGINSLTGWVLPPSHIVVLNKPMVAKGFPRSLADKESPFCEGDPGSIPGSGRSP